MAEVLQFPFSAGQEEGVDPKQLPAGQPSSVLNGVWDKEKRMRKRFGSGVRANTIVGGGAIASGARLVSRGSDTQLIDGTSLYAYVPTSAAWNRVDRMPNLRATWDTLVDTSRGVQVVDQDVYGGTLFVAYLSNDDLFFMAVEIATGAKVVRPVLIEGSSPANPRVVVDPAAGVVHIFYTLGAGNIRARRVDLTTLAISSAVTVAATVSSSVFDVCTDGTSLWFVYELAAGANRLRVIRTDTSTSYAAAATTAVNLTVTTYKFMGIALVGNNVAIIWSEGTGPAIGVASFVASTLATVVAPTLALNLIGAAGVSIIALDTTSAIIAYTHDTVAFSNASEPTRFSTFNTSTGTVTQGALNYHTRISTKLFTVGGRFYIGAQTFLVPSAISDAVEFPQWTQVILEVEPTSAATGISRVMAVIAPSTAWPTFRAPPKVAVGSDGVYRVALPYAIDPPPKGWNGTNMKLGFWLASLTPSAGDIWRPVLAGPTPMCAAGAPFWCDGSTTSPVGFLHAPVVLSTGHSLGGGNQLAGSYLYAGVYVYKDSDGREHRSPPSAASTVTTGAANETVTVTFSTTSLSSRQSETTGYSGNEPNLVRIEIYRSTCNGSTLYKHPGILFNDPTVHTVTYTDTFADDNIFGSAPNITLASRPRIYTDAGGLDDVAPPSFLTALVHRERIWGIAGDEHTVWASKPQSEDPLVAPGFNEALTVGYSKKKSALGAIDSMVIVLGPDSIDVIDGDGPDNKAEGAWARSSIQADVGCISPQSVVSIPPGLLFQSVRGLELLTRERSLTWLGKSVQDTLNLYPTITSAVLDAEHHIVRFTCNKADLSDGIVLVFDYLRGAWATHDYGLPIADALMIDGVYTFLSYGGIVHYEDETTCRDSGVWVPLAVEIPMSPSGPNGWHMLRHIQLLGTSVTDHQLTIKYARDFGADFEQIKTYAAGTPVTRIGPLEQARITPRNGKAQAFRIRIEDAAPEGDDGTSTGQGPILEGLALYVQRKPGLPKTSAPRKG